jgi:hypothetical protein
MAQTVLVVGWGYYLCSVEVNRSAFSLTLGFALSGALGLMFGSLPDDVVRGLAVVAMPLSGVFLVIELSKADTTALADGPFDRLALRGLSLPLILLLFTCTLTGVFVHTLVPTNQIQHGSGYQLLTPLVYALVSVVYFMWTIFPGRGEAQRLWPLFPAVVLGGLLFYTSFIGSRPGLAMDVLTATQNCTILFCWIVTAAMVYQKGLPRVFSFCISNIVFAEPITLSINLTGLLRPDGGTGASDVAAIGVTLGLALLLVALTMVFVYLEALRAVHERDDEQEALTLGLAVPVDPLVSAVAALAEDYALTPREQEIALNLACGRTFPSLR